MRHPIDNRIHVSELKAFAKSPAHYAYACSEARTVTRPMRVGAVADALVFGDRGYAVYPGKSRNGKEWETWEAANAGRIMCIQSEFDDAAGAARAVLSDPVAAALLEGGQYQLALQWDAYGLPMAAGIPGVRGGVDLVGPGRKLTDGEPFVADLKITDSEPFALARHAWKMMWHAQLAAYLDACEALGVDAGGGFTPRRGYIIACEPNPPHVVTVLPVSAKAIDHGRKSLHVWAERLRQCERDDRWPGYVDGMADEMWVPEWERGEEEDIT